MIAGGERACYNPAMALAPSIQALLGPGVPIAVQAYDGSASTPPGALATLVIERPEGLQRFLAAPNDLGLARAYVAGDLDLQGDLFGALESLARRADRGVELDRRALLDVVRSLGVGRLRPLAPPPEEVRLHGVRHTRARDAAAVAHHYDVSNEFYDILLGPSMTYSCAVWHDPTGTLEDAQAAKHELVSRKLGLAPGMRLLDVGCGWGGMVLHAASHHGVEAVGVTVSPRQVERASKRIAEAGLDGQVDVRLQDYRDVTDGPYDAISSIGMFEHVGHERLRQYAAQLYAQLRPGGRLLNHGIGRPAAPADAHRLPRPPRPGLPRTFVQRFVFPDGELNEVGGVVSALQHVGFEVRHLENLREHYGLTARAWVANLERQWDRAVELVGEGRARVWRLYLAASAVGFEDGRLQVHQILAVKPDAGRSGMPLRPSF